MAVHILGIRHHGPGSARNVKTFLEQVKPDIVLVEGPPEADGILQWATHKELKPPVAILCYQPDDPEHSSFYPFAEFSPEWQAILYAKKNNIHLRFMDLPAANQFALEAEKRKQQETEAKEGGNELPQNDLPLNCAMQQKMHHVSRGRPTKKILASADTADKVFIPADPVSYLAQAAGFDDGEKWWEQMFEHRLANEQVFEAVAEAMHALRETLPAKEDRLEQLREAHMRKTIRQAEKELFQNIAVVCGAWHAPALNGGTKQKDDNELLKGLPKAKVECTWVPWTYSRLSFYSGYGAGIASPGWYHHIWKYPADNGTRWMAKVAKLFRQKQMDTSVAHIIEAVRLAGALAALRNFSRPGLDELNEATLSILCNGEPFMMSLLQNELIVTNRIGNVPAEIPKPPLQLDIEKTQKKLRLPASADWKDYTLDLRNQTDLDRSVFLHRLQLLGIKWGHRSEISGKGTFKEQWRLQWDPAFSIDIIEKGSWGNTTQEAAEKYVMHCAEEAATLPEITGLLAQTIPAVLPAATELIVQRINNLSAASGDVMQLMEAIPGLVTVSRYGNVRKTDTELVLGIIQSMFARICISLPGACTGIDEDVAAEMTGLFYKMTDAVNTLQQNEMTAAWQHTLNIIAYNKNTAPVIGGYSTRLLADYKILAGEELVKVFYYALSPAGTVSAAAAWLEGFLKGSGTLLLVDEDLWNVVNNWVDGLDAEIFIQVLPMLRRSFSNFTKPERRKLGEKVKLGKSGPGIKQNDTGLDEERAEKAIEMVMKMMGYSGWQESNEAQ